MSTCWPSPAKINRFLHITHRRADGYHELQSVFQYTEFADQLQIDLMDAADQVNQIEIHVQDQRVQRPAVGASFELNSQPIMNNACYRAARALQRKHAKPVPGIRIRLDKYIPIGGGLGGGSSNAATTLVALNRLWNCQLTHHELSQLGLEIGADVPFFIQGQSAWVEGIGERILPISIDALPDEPIWLLLPNVSVSTPDVYRHPALQRDKPAIPFSADWSSKKMSEIIASAENVMTAVVASLYPAVQQLIDAMQTMGLADKVRMSGSGSTFYLTNPPSEATEADTLKQILDDLSVVVIETYTRAQSSLHLAEAREAGISNQ